MRTLRRMPVLSEARKFRLSLIVAHQYLSQLDARTAESTEGGLSRNGFGRSLPCHKGNRSAPSGACRVVWGNVGSIVAFQVGSDDAETLAQQLGKYPGQIAPQYLTGLPKHVAYARLLIDGLPSNPFSLETLPPPTVSDPQRAEIVRRVAQRRFAAAVPTVAAVSEERRLPRSALAGG